MKAILAAALLCVSTSAFAATKTYQVTGPVLDVTDSTITVQKGQEKWELVRDASVKTEVKKGDKVTIAYTMTATDIEVKGAKPEKTTKK